MSIWIDPLVPTIDVPSDLDKEWFRLGSAKFQLLPKQYQFLSAKEEFVGYVSGYGGGKTRVGAIRAAFLSMEPNNRGLVGMEAATDLDEAAQRDLLEFLHEAELLKEAPNSQKRRAIVHCIDPSTGENLGATSEISFVHLDDPKHVRGRHLGWFWIDEGSKVKREAWQNLIGRLRLPSFRNRYKAYVTGNPEGRNWIFDFFFNEELLSTLTCRRPECKLSDKECNRRLRIKRRAIHCTSYENYFLPPEYIENMLSSFTEEERKRYLEGSFDVFEGQAFKEFDHDIHVFQPPPEWIDGRPPKEWKRILACDVGGATYWAFIWCAVDPFGNLIFYDEIYSKTTNIDQLANQALPKMLNEEGQPYNFQSKVIDYENKLAAEDLRRRGIAFTNAQKHGKASSVQRFSGYLHRNAKHHFPEYHPLKGQPNSPRAFFTYGVRNLIRELPQQRWKEETGGDGRLRNELDRSIDNHATDCLHGDTLVLTKRGVIPIRELVGTTGEVMTPVGWAEYLGAAKTRPMSATVTLEFSNGEHVRTTPDHLFLTPTGWVKARDMLDCACYIYSAWKTSSLTESAIGNTAENAISVGASSDCTEWYGSTTTGQFLPAITSITKTGIQGTTLSTIWNSLLPATILANIVSSTAIALESILIQSGLWPQSGMAAEMEFGGTGGISMNLWRPHFERAYWSAGGARSHSRAFLVMLDQRRSAPIAAEPLSGEPQVSTMSSAHALRAGMSSQSIATPSNDTVRCVAVRRAENADTYCLHVNHPIHAFAVNSGIFVHNCALYIARELPDPTTLKPVKWAVTTNNMSKISELYYADRRRQEELKSSTDNARKPYRIHSVPIDILD